MVTERTDYAKTKFPAALDGVDAAAPDGTEEVESSARKGVKHVILHAPRTDKDLPPV